MQIMAKGISKRVIFHTCQILDRVEVFLNYLKLSSIILTQVIEFLSKNKLYIIFRK